MRLPLLPHPDCASSPVQSVTVEAERSGASLRLRYVLVGAIRAIALPPPAAPARADGLWRHSCFEAFVRRAGSDDYVELNLSPSTQWAAYCFDGYRSGMTKLDIPFPVIQLLGGADRFELAAELELHVPGSWLLGLSAVIEETNGRLSYWALRHPSGKPDFHHRDCFTVQLPPAA